ncbi:branched-chain amino acid ABC transporter permease [Reinekea marina]|uniref:Branched-chain amino acid ABC transporter permease n=1 Tax=Reinekea marina TaxID=1310421 RepID=A0ABV7WNG5_9GAMM|nr:branched-chain amino acid ABC transporter permease [Reinekea marina]MDN3649940.1 branched-chain amino acid ABC transporter permease [Reinekea marina]
MAQVIQYLLNGIMNGALYALIAVGIVSIFKSTKVVSFAHGHIIMFGAYFYFTFAVILPGAEFMPDWVAKWEPEWLLAYKEGAMMFSPKAAIAAWVSNLPRIILGVVGSLVCNALLAVFIERVFMRPLIGKSSLSMILCTVGLIWVLEGSASLIWSADIDQVPPLGPNFPIRFTVFDSQVFLFSSSAINFVIALMIFIGLLLVLRFTRSGVAIRATAEDQSTAYAMGINVPAVFTTAWVVAATTGAIAGAILASRNGLSPTLGLFGLSVLAVVLMGGLDSYAGVFIASMIIGIFEAFTQWKFGGEYAEIVPYVLVLLVIIWRPNGLMGQAEIERI